MKLTFALVVLFIWLAIVMSLARAQATEITGSASSPPTAIMPCTMTNATTTVQWQNTTGAPVYVTDGYVWVGESGMGRSDTSYAVWTNGGALMILQSNWDHYGEPSGINDNIQPFPLGGNYFTVNAGARVTLLLGCTGPYSDVPAKVQGRIFLHYTTVRP